MFMKHYAPNRCEPSIEALDFGGGGEGDQGRCERRSDVFVKSQKKKSPGPGGGGGGQGRCERRSEVFVKIKKIIYFFLGGGGGGRVGSGWMWMKN